MIELRLAKKLPTEVHLTLFNGSVHKVSFATRELAELFVDMIPGWQLIGEQTDVYKAKIVPLVIGIN